MVGKPPSVVREEMLADLQRTVRLCNCLWPVQKYRNGDGHNPCCPAHVPLGSKRPSGCDSHMVDHPKVTLIEDGVQLSWSCCGISSAVQQSTPFRLYPELVRYLHKSAVEMRDAQHA